MIENFGRGKAEAVDKRKTQEVFTDDAIVIGPNDATEYLEALPLSCAIMTVARPEKGVVGMMHCSLGLYEAGVADLTRQLNQQLGVHGMHFSECDTRLFNADEMLVEEIKKALAQYGVSVPYSEFMPDAGVRISKRTGEVTFFSLQI